jgi:hypothetical protein
MELVINVDALDKTNSAVVSATDRTAVDDLEMLTVGNVEPMTVRFCDNDGVTPSWVADADTVVAVGVGAPDVDGGQSYASTTLTGSPRSGVLDLDTAALRSASYSWQCCRHYGRLGRWFTMEIRRTTYVTGSITAAESVALLSVFVALPVLAPV